MIRRCEGNSLDLLLKKESNQMIIKVKNDFDEYVEDSRTIRIRDRVLNKLKGRCLVMNTKIIKEKNTIKTFLVNISKIAKNFYNFYGDI